MTRILKKAPAPHVVIVDTNALWHKDKQHVVSPDFETAWAAACNTASLELVIPETVRGELLFQQTTSAWKHLEKVAESLMGISSICGKTHTTKLSRDVIKAQVISRFDKWARGNNATIAPTPFHTIDWSTLAEDAIWRRTPFLPDAKLPEAEKGFRDALIMHTVCSVVSAESRLVDIVFVCGDQVLQRATAEKLKTKQHFSAYDDFGGFGSFLKLTREKLNRAFIAAILDRASQKFYAPNDVTCLYYREKLIDQLRSQFKDLFEQPDLSEKPHPLLGTLTQTSHTPWTPLSAGTWALVKPEFVSIDEKANRYLWVSQLQFTRAYRREAIPFSTLGGSRFPSFPDPWNERLLVLAFDVAWKAKVKADARFYNTAIDKISLRSNELRTLTPDERAEYVSTSGGAA